MLLTLYSLWEEAAAGTDVIVTGEGVACNPQIGSGLVLIRTGTVGGFIKRPKKPARQRGHVDFVQVPIDVELVGAGVHARPHVTRGSVLYDYIIHGTSDGAVPKMGAGNVIIKVDFSDEELVALLMAA